MNKEILDQHFMIDNSLIKRIIGYSELKEKDVVLEIGPGKGVLTDKILEQARVIAVELDKDLYYELKDKYKENSNIRLINSNALKEILKWDFNKIVSNIPYSISEPLIIKILIKQPEIVVITTGINFKTYLEANKLLNMLYEYEIKEEVPKKSFYPSPNTESIVVKLKLKHTKESGLFKELLVQYDKKLKNALINIFNGKFTKNQVRDKISSFKSKNKSILNMPDEEIDSLTKIFC